MVTRQLCGLGAMAAIGAVAAACSSATAPRASTTEPPPTFKADVAPVIYKSCALTACHASKQSDNGFFVNYDPAVVYAAMFKDSVKAPGVKLVVAGNPKASFLMHKLDGTQGELGAKCPGGCGVVMPQDEMLDAPTRDLFRSWIAAGAKND